MHFLYYIYNIHNKIQMQLVRYIHYAFKLLEIRNLDGFMATWRTNRLQLTIDLKITY